MLCKMSDNTTTTSVLMLDNGVPDIVPNAGRRSRTIYITEDDVSFWTARGTLHGSHITGKGDSVTCTVWHGADRDLPVPWPKDSVLSALDHDPHPRQAISGDTNREPTFQDSQSSALTLQHHADPDLTVSDEDSTIPKQLVAYVTPLRQAASTTCNDTNWTSTFRNSRFSSLATTFPLPHDALECDETPMPSHILYVYHPPIPLPAQYQGSDDAPPNSFTPSALVATTKSEAEAALWHLVGPPVIGMQVMSEAIWQGATSLITLFCPSPTLQLSDNQTRSIDNDSLRDQ